MHCPYCNTNNTKVVDSRLDAEGFEVKRRRNCLSCGDRFTTYERLDRRFPRVLKKNSSLQLFQEDKIRRGIQRSVEKRPVANASIEAIIEQVCEQILKLGKDQVSSDQIGNLILKELSGLDDVAYVRFASVYRRFDSIQDFTEELNSLNLSNKTEKEI